MQTNFEVIRDGVHWVVRCQSAERGRFLSQIQAFNAAVAEARKIKEIGRKVHVRIVREDAAHNENFLTLL